MGKKIIDGVATAESILLSLQKKTQAIKEKFKESVSLRVIMVGTDPASEVYTKAKDKKAKACGIDSQIIKLPESTTQEALLGEVQKTNQDTSIHGVMVQLPLPKHLSVQPVIHSILPEKDIDGFHQSNMGRVLIGGEGGMSGLLPCTPKGCMKLIFTKLKSVDGLNATVVGASNIVGKPMAAMLINHGATVSIANSKTKDLPSICKTADILISAAGVPSLIKPDCIKDGALIIDVGISRIDGKIVGDVSDECYPKASAYTPVPGGVGPMTIACLLENAVIAYCKQKQINFSQL